MEAAAAVPSDPAAVRKSALLRDDFDTALEELADSIQAPGERFYKAYGRALESPEGTLLYTARELATTPDYVWKREAPVLSKSEHAIADAVTAYCADHPEYSREKALIRVLDSNPSLYREYERECSEKEKG
jgi:hypothetical protein